MRDKSALLLNGLRDYGVDGQIGLEETPEQWVERLVEVFSEVKRVLRDDGTLWVEVGDSYAVRGQARSIDYLERTGGNTGLNSRNARTHEYAPIPNHYKPKDLIGAPWLLAKRLQQPHYTGQIKNDVDRVWLAAVIDGEGCIAIHKRPAGTPAYSSFRKNDGTISQYMRTKDSFQPKLEISNTSLALIERVIEITGEGNANVKQEAGTFGRKQTIYRWTVTADKARSVLREVYPHLIAKPHEARLAYGCPSSGEQGSAAHEALKLLHGGHPTGIDFPAPESLWEAGWYLRSDIIWARKTTESDARVDPRPADQSTLLCVSFREERTVFLRPGRDPGSVH